MRIWIALFRGINVGGHHKIPMKALRRLGEAAGLKDPTTYIQSGNVVFESKSEDARALAAGIESAVEAEFGFRPMVVLRTVEEFREVVARNPFRAEAQTAPNKLAVCFLKEMPAVPEAPDLASYAMSGERMERRGQELYIYFPAGMGKSKLRIPALERALAGSDGRPNAATSRNWNTVEKLLEMAANRP